jgi:hypothetical protein
MRLREHGSREISVVVIRYLVPTVEDIEDYMCAAVQ